VEFDASQRNDGTAIAITGFLLLNIRPVSSRGYIGAYTLDPRSPVQMVLDRASWPGGSGSPVYDAKGNVLRMVLQTGEAWLGAFPTRAQASRSQSLLRRT
jgi:hypothetical protein